MEDTHIKMEMFTKEIGKITSKKELESCFTRIKEIIMVLNTSQRFWQLRIGEFKGGKRDGEGLYTFPNKDIYSGKWRNGKKHGKGTYRFADTQMKVNGSSVTVF